MSNVLYLNSVRSIKGQKENIPLDADYVPEWCLEIIADLVAICETRALGSTRAHLLDLVHKIRLEGGFEPSVSISTLTRGQHES